MFLPILGIRKLLVTALVKGKTTDCTEALLSLFQLYTLELQSKLRGKKKGRGSDLYKHA